MTYEVSITVEGVIRRFRVNAPDATAARRRAEEFLGRTWPGAHLMEVRLVNQPSRRR